MRYQARQSRAGLAITIPIWLVRLQLVWCPLKNPHSEPHKEYKPKKCKERDSFRRADIRQHLCKIEGGPSQFPQTEKKSLLHCLVNVRYQTSKLRVWSPSWSDKSFIIVFFIPYFVFGFWSLLATKLQKYYVIFVYILQGKMSKMEKKITQLKWPKYQKPKDENMGWTKHMFPRKDY